MPAKSASSQRNVVEQIDELKRKLQLLEGDKKAYYEKAEYSMQQNKERTTTLRSENKELRRSIADKLAADELVVSKGLEENPVERKALRSKPGSVALVVMDEKLQDRMNALNTARYQTRKKRERLEELRTQQRTKSNQAAEAAAVNPNESEDAQTLRSLENRLDKANLKCKEAEHIQKTYQQIKAKLEDEQKTFSNTLDDMEQEIERMKRQLKELKVIRTDAQVVRDQARSELEKQEKEIYADRRRRELEIQKVRKEAEEKRVQQELFQKRIAARQSVAQDNMNNDQKQVINMAEEDQEKIQSYEDAFRVIKEATGVSDTQEVVKRFESQGDTQHHLEKLKEDNEQQIAELTETRETLREEFEQMKYTGEAKLSSGERLLEEFESHVAEDESRRDESLAALEKSSTILTDVRSGIEHLTEKLKSIKLAAADAHRTRTSHTPDEFVLDQLSTCEEKLTKILDELDASSTGGGGGGAGGGTASREGMRGSRRAEDAEYQVAVDLRLPAHNTRVKLPAVAKETMYEDDDASGEDEDVLTRQSLKKQSQQLVDAKTRRRLGGKGRKKKINK